MGIQAPMLVTNVRNQSAISNRTLGSTPFVNMKSLIESQSAPLNSVEVVDPDGDIHRQNS